MYRRASFRSPAWGQFHERQYASDAFNDFLQGYHNLRGPEPAFFERHELDEPDNYAFFTREPREAFNLIVVESTQQHAIDLERRESRGPGNANALEHCLEAAGDTRDALESGGVDCVHAHCYAVEARRFEWCGQFVEHVSVGGEREVKRLILDGAQAG